MGITVQTFYRWKKKYSGMLPCDLRKLRQLEDENRQLMKLVADLSLDKQMLQDVLSKNSKACDQKGYYRLASGPLLYK